MSDSIDPYSPLVIASDGSYAAGRDQTIHLHAIPCADCEKRFVLEATQVCRHCAIRGVVIGAVMLWIVLAALAVRACAWADLGSDAQFGATIAAAFVAFQAGLWFLKRRPVQPAQ